MSKFNLTGASINATNLHLGDINNYYSSQDFINRNPGLKLTETEMQLVKIIFEHTESEQERELILKSLRSIKDGEGTVEEKKASILSFKPLLSKLRELGEKVAVGITTKFITDYASQ